MNQHARGPFHQPDDPGMRCCPNCGYKPPQDEEEAIRRLLRKNAGRVPKSVIALAAGRSVRWLEKFARNCKPPFDLALKRDDDPRGA